MGWQSKCPSESVQTLEACLSFCLPDPAQSYPGAACLKCYPTRELACPKVNRKAKKGEESLSFFKESKLYGKGVEEASEHVFTPS